MGIDVKNKIKKSRSRTFLAKDFESFRAELLTYARVYFPDKIKDFSEASMGGLFLDMAAYVGDSLSYYLDHQFTELNPLTAVERKNILRHLRMVGVEVVGSAPSSVYVKFYLKIPAEQKNNGTYGPKTSALPFIRNGTVTTSASGVNFNLVEDLDFGAIDENGVYTANLTIYEKNDSGNPTSYVMSLQGLCVSGNETVDEFNIGSSHVPFREVTLLNTDVSDIISISDSDGETYYQTETLSQDTVFKAVMNLDDDGNYVPMNLEVISAPRRFVAKHDPTTRLSKVRFGSGDAETFDDDIIPDPSQLSLPLYGKKTFHRFAIDPNALLKTQTLGLSPKGVKLKVRYRYGGGLSHNVAAGSIRLVKHLNMDFQNTPTAADSVYVRGSIEIKNLDPARGGDAAPTLEELRTKIPSARQMQSRIVSKQDLLSRIYTMPNEFGRVYRAGIRTNPVNPLSAELFIISRDRYGKLTTSPDALKKNLSTYLNEFRLISDAIDILDASISNFTVKFGIMSAPGANKNGVIQNVISRIKDIMSINNFQIDQPILLDDITNVIINTPGVVSLLNLEVSPKTGIDSDRSYSNFYFDYAGSTRNKIIVAPAGNIFELKYPDSDIIGSAL
jgi:hypothetical protein